MAHPIGKKEESRAHILAGAGRGFRSLGYGGVGVDGLAKEAGVTSGAFYAHFKSKAEAFREAVRAGMHDLTTGIASFQAEGGAWLPRFVAFYMGPRRQAELADSCALQSLTGEVARADSETRAAYETEFRAVLATLQNGLGNDPKGRHHALAMLAMLSGGVSISRAVADPALAEEIAEAITRVCQELTENG